MKSATLILIAIILSSPILRAQDDSTGHQGKAGRPVTRFEADSMYKSTIFMVKVPDTSGARTFREVSWDNVKPFFANSAMYGQFGTLRDSGFVLVGLGCIKIWGKLGRYATKDTIFIQDTCSYANPCMHDVTIPLGYWDTVSVIAWEPVKRWHCDSLCQVQIGRIIDTSYVIIPDSTVQAIKTDQLYTYGAECADARFVTPKVCLRKRGASWFGNLRDVDSTYQWKTCQSGDCINDSTCCVRYSLLFSYILSSRYGPTITLTDSTYVVYDTETLLYWNGHCDESEFPRARITATAINCDSLVDSPKVYLKPVWHPFGRDTVITITDCSIKCPVGRVKSATFATYDTTWRTEPIYENTIIGYDTTVLGAKTELYHVVDSVEAHLILPSPRSGSITRTALLAWIASNPAVYDTVPGGYIYDRWKIGKIPVTLDECGQLSQIDIHDVCYINENLWDANNLVNYSSCTVVVAWLDSVAFQSFVGCSIIGCSVDRVHSHSVFGYPDCYDYQAFYYTCKKNYLANLLGYADKLDSVMVQVPRADSLCTTVINPIYRLDSIGTRTWAEITTTPLAYPIFTFEIYDSCGVDNIVNLCPDGRQPFRIGTTWYIDAAPCASIPDVSGLPTNADIDNLLARWKTALTDTLDNNPRSSSSGGSATSIRATLTAQSEITVAHSFLSPYVRVTAYRTFSGKDYQISESDIAAVQAAANYVRVKFIDAETGFVQVEGLIAGSSVDSLSFSGVSEVTIPRTASENVHITAYRVYNGKNYKIPQSDILAVELTATYARIRFTDSESGFVMLSR